MKGTPVWAAVAAILLVLAGLFPVALDATSPKVADAVHTVRIQTKHGGVYYITPAQHSLYYVDGTVAVLAILTLGWYSQQQKRGG